MDKDKVIQKQDELINWLSIRLNDLESYDKYNQLQSELSALKSAKEEDTGITDEIIEKAMQNASQFQSVQSKEVKRFTGHWWCEKCKRSVPPVNVTFEEIHEDCGYPVEWIEAESVKGEGEIRKEIEDLMIIVWHGGQKSEHEGGESFEDSLKKDGSPIQPFDMTVKDVIDTIMQMISNKHSESKEQWISVKDRLPEKMERVLCYNGYRVLEQSWCSYTNHDIDWFKKEFTHWVPLPEPPKS